METYSKRTHTCGELGRKQTGEIVTLTGWVDTRRDLGGLIFIDLRDRYGKTQVVFSNDKGMDAYGKAKTLRSEFVISVTGIVEERPEGAKNREISTGEIDIRATALSILNKSETPPFPIEDEVDVTEDLRFAYRYLDLRRPRMQKNLLLRHEAYQIVRSYFDRNGFVEIETPILMKSTPEGARDFLVPSRMHKGKFYALPQSPQTYKQILMVAGFDRYFQIVKCFRDEDLRADRQPEFTQIDVEMSFVDEVDVYSMTEGVMEDLFSKLLGVDIKLPFKRMTYIEAMEKYGSDKPDDRYGLQLSLLSDIVSYSNFKGFRETVEKGGIVAGFAVPGLAGYTRSQLDGLTALAKSFGAGGLVYMRVHENKVESSIDKFIFPDEAKKMVERIGGKPGDLCLIISGFWQKTLTILGALRLEMIRRLKLKPNLDWSLLWITDFPLLEFDDEEKRFVAVHHPFTSPKTEDVGLLDTDPGRARARAYDLVLNGNEIAGGSIRIHDAAMQSKMFGLLGINAEEAKKKFGFILDAFRFGAPPHGGIAFGFDRIIMLFSGEESIRDVIAFPKTSSGFSLMDESPSEVDEKQLRELGIGIIKK